MTAKNVEPSCIAIKIWMDKENVEMFIAEFHVAIKKWNHDICRKWMQMEINYAYQSKTEKTEKETLCGFSYKQNLDLQLYVYMCV